MNYLKYIEHDAENLQFFLWYRSYVDRWMKLPESEKALAPEWTTAQAEALPADATVRPRKVDPMVASILKGTDFDEKTPAKTSTNEKVDPFRDGARTPSSEDSKRGDLANSEYGSSFGDSKTLNSSHTHVVKADEAFENAGLQWKPCKSSFRPEAYLAKLITSQSLLNLTVRKSVVSLPSTWPMKLHVSSISQAVSAMPSWLHSNKPLTPLPSSPLSRPLNGLCAVRPTPTSFAGPSATATVLVLFLLVASVLEVSLLVSS